MKRFPNDQFGFSVSHTTRKPREGEVDGKHYNFTTVEAMKKGAVDFLPKPFEDDDLLRAIDQAIEKFEKAHPDIFNIKKKFGRTIIK